MKKIKFPIKKTVLFVVILLNLSFIKNTYPWVNPITIEKDYNYYNWEWDVNIRLNKAMEPESYYKSPTLAYASVPQFTKYLLCDHYWDNLKDQIVYIGTEYIEPIVNKVIKNTIQYSDNYFTFFHGQRREFRLLQDLYTKLYEIFNKTTLKDFCFIRVPNQKYDTIKTIDDFIDQYQWEMENSSYPDNVFDNNKEANKHILSVNPSLFSNTMYSLDRYVSECTFKYFIRSDNITSINILNFVEEMFNTFNIHWIFSKYKYDIQYLIHLLQEDEIHKTGNLLQIFIPKNIVDKIVYRSKQGGVPFYGTDITHHLSTQQILENFPQTLDDLAKQGFYYPNNYFATGTMEELDEFQCRILLTTEYMLNPNSTIKIIPFTTKTPNIKIYLNKSKKLFKKIAKDIKKEGPGLIDKLFISIGKLKHALIG